MPVTLLVVVAMLAAGVLTRTLSGAADPTDPAVTNLQFGLPAFRAGRWWTLFSGALVFTRPEFYLIVGAMLVVGLGTYERRVGSMRAAAVLLITHTVGIVVPALMLWPFAGSGWAWAATLATHLDAGLSAGGFGVAAAATTLPRPPWRGRLRLLGSAVLTVLVIKSGVLWDLEHWAAWATGLAIGPRVGASRVTEGPRERSMSPPAPPRSSAQGAAPAASAGRAEVRVVSAVIGAGFAISSVVESVYPGLGGLVGPGAAPTDLRGIWLVVGELAISLLIVGALPRPRAIPWWVAVIGLVAIAINSALSTAPHPHWGDAVCSILVLGVLAWNRRCWPWRSDRAALRPLMIMAALTIGYTVAASCAIWAVRNRLVPQPGVLDVVREVSARFTFSTGPIGYPAGAARAVLIGLNLAWVVVVVSWLVWALYLSSASRPVAPFSARDRQPLSGPHRRVASTPGDDLVRGEKRTDRR